MSGQHATPLLQFQGITRTYRSGDTEIRALDGVSFEIQAGEFVAIMGQSGSGKSTLMNIIGCLDRPTEGVYRVRGNDIATLSPDALAALRRDTFGFVFQRYNLLAESTAAENVELPAVYASHDRRERAQRARTLLERLGLGDRIGHRPTELSGGQQQRVSIARALMNGAEVILADEPTGALDSATGAEVLALFKRLHAEGRTIILITHDAGVAQAAQRVIHLRDGRIVDAGQPVARRAAPAPRVRRGDPHWLPQLGEAVKLALRSLRTDWFRSALTLLGVVIGVASVVTMMAVGNGSKAAVLERIEAMGTNLLLVRPRAPGGRSGGDVVTLVPADAEALRAIANVAHVSPQRRSTATVRHGADDHQTSIQGAWPDHEQTQDWKLASGSFINDTDVKTYAAVAVLGKTVASTLFAGADPIGQFVLIGNVPFEVIGVLEGKGANAFGQDQDDTVLVPLSTGFIRLFGKQYLDTINVEVTAAEHSDTVQAAVTDLLRERHGIEDFQVLSTASIMEMASATQNTLTVLLGVVAAISLLVGGIGVMNIMLVNVTERTREIGVRVAVGARRGNILLQFNTEALVICGVGGVAGVVLGVLVGVVVDAFGTRVEFTPAPPLVAFATAVVTGLVFGYLPARKAARMDPVAALASE